MTYFSLDDTPAYADLRAERRRQDQRWGEQNHPDGTGLDLIQAGYTQTLAQTADLMRVRTKAAAGEIPNLPTDLRETLTWRHILLQEVYEALAEHDPAALRTELIQAGAVIVAWIEAIDRRTAGRPPDAT